MTEEIKWVKIFSSADPIECGIIRSMVEEHEIPVVILNQQDSAYVSIGEIQLLAPVESADEARLLILSFQDS